MDDKPAISQLKPFLKRSTNTSGTRSLTKNQALNPNTSSNLPRHTSYSPKNTQNKNNHSTSLNSPSPAQPIENLTQKSFAKPLQTSPSRKKIKQLSLTQ